jgi:hypothetical protein
MCKVFLLYLSILSNLAEFLLYLRVLSSKWRGRRGRRRRRRKKRRIVKS